MITQLISRRATAAMLLATLAITLPGVSSAQNNRPRSTGSWMMFIHQDTNPPDKCAHPVRFGPDGLISGPATSLPSKDNPFSEGGLEGEWTFDGSVIRFGFTRAVITSDGKEIGLERVQFNARWSGDQMVGTGTGELFDIDGNVIGIVPLRVRLIRVLPQQ